MNLDLTVAAMALLGALTCLTLLGICDLLWNSSVPHFGVGLALIYYFSLAGAWKVIRLKAEGTPDPSVDHLEASLFPLIVDSNYMLTMGIYAIFIFSLVIFLRLGLEIANRKSGVVLLHPNREPPRVRTGLILTISAVSFVLSALLMWDAVTTSLDTGISAYNVSRHEDNQYVTIHQLLNRVGIYALTIGVTVTAARKGNRGAWLVYLPLAVLWIAYLGALGNRNELLVSIVAASLLFYSVGGRIRRRWLASFGFLGFLVLRLIEYSRFYGLGMLSDNMGTIFTSANFWNPLALASGSESVAAHMSLYGIISKDLEHTNGSSVTYLINSLIPRNLLPTRVDDSYTIYADAMNAPSSQGFTIHFAAACFLNYGITAVILGALVLAGIWCLVFRWAGRGRAGSLFRVSPALVAFCFCSAFIPVAMRNGPEGLKGLVVEAILIPYLVARLALIHTSPKRA